uniref:ACYPI001564 protein n=1 Tax=Acyrthosiphon pisum TaxID=7029 RepID=C4WU71_ACYPI|nr:ACYPI001564 [Acyrthosiphon pisum]
MSRANPNTLTATVTSRDPTAFWKPTVPPVPLNTPLTTTTVSTPSSRTLPRLLPTSQLTPHQLTLHQPTLHQHTLHQPTLHQLTLHRPTSQLTDQHTNLFSCVDQLSSSSFFHVFFVYLPGPPRSY